MQPSAFDVMSNGKKTISIDLKRKEGVDVMKKLCSKSDVLLDTYRPGVLEKLGLGPDVLLKENPRLIYARLTGYGQKSVLKDKGGHDINYVAMSGVLSLLGNKTQRPMPPLNLLADFAGGSVMCALGIVLALFERTKSGKGQIIDASMTESLAYIASWMFKSRDLPIWSGEPGTNVLDGGFHFYNTYKTKDGKYMAVGSMEAPFYSDLLKGLELSEAEYGQFSEIDKSTQKFEQVFLQKTQEEWRQIFEKLDACVTPVLDFDSIDKYEYYESTNTFKRDSNNRIVPGPAPRLSNTPGESVGHKPTPVPGQDTIPILQELGYSKSDIDDLIKNGYVYAHNKSHL